MENKKVILVVEDDTPLLNALKEKLSDAGFTVLGAKNGEDGLASALSGHPDLIVLDILMPKMDGLEMLKKMREDAWGKNVPVMILTNLSDDGSIAHQMTEETFDYIIKSDIKIEAVVEKVKAKLGV